MNSPILYYKLKMPIIPCLIYITTGKDMLERWATRQHFLREPFVQEFLGDEIGGCCVPMTGGAIHLVLPEEYDAEVVFHEALHAATQMWYDVGANLEVPRNDEVLCYTQSYIVNYIKEVCYADSK